MGAIWSQNITPRTEHDRIPPPPAKRRRLNQPSSQFTTPPDMTALVKHASKPPQAQAPDSTPDGSTHRYIVRCTTIFWSTRKDIVKQIAKIPDMPPYGAVQKVSKWDHFFITFPNRPCALRGLVALNSHHFRGEPWRASEMAPLPPSTRDRKQARHENSPQSLSLTAADVTAKWRHLPYDEQVQRKRRKWLGALRLVSKNLRKELRNEKGIIPWLDQLYQAQVGKGSPTCCQLEDPVVAQAGAERMYYRNKNEFTVGLSPPSPSSNHPTHQPSPTVGYALGLVKDGTVFVGALDEQCYTTSVTARDVANALTAVIRNSNMPPYDKKAHDGYWRQITCREGTRTGQVIVSVVVKPLTEDEEEKLANLSHYSDAECRLQVVKALQDHFGTKKQLGVFWQPSDHVSAISSDIPAIHLHGITALHEDMCALKFRIQPTAFFQVNTLMAEKLYNLIGDLAKVDKESAVLDVCCGTGTIGLSLANRAHSVVGIEMNESAIEDAVYNAKLNAISNATFIAGKVENYIHDAIKRIEGNRECVVILDPPRAGLPMNVVSAVRAMKAVKRIVYVACEPNNFWKNALGFCRPRSKAFRLQPFRPVKAVGLDLFPHTDHGELAIVLEREDAEESIV